MKTVVVISDTHGNLNYSPEFERVLLECDIIIHLGDTSQDAIKLKSRLGDKLILINGNCDLTKLGDDEKLLEIEGVKLYLTHGHRYKVKSTLLPLSLRARELGANLALYGHTHDARVDELDDLTLINPGTLSRFSRKSYLYLVISNSSYTHKLVWLN